RRSRASTAEASTASGRSDLRDVDHVQNLVRRSMQRRLLGVAGMSFADARFDREVILEQAARARTRRQWRRPIGLYRQVAAVEPNNGQIHERPAPMPPEPRTHFNA